MASHFHDLPVCGYGAHKPNAPDCAGMGALTACGTVVDPAHPQFGRAQCEHKPVAVGPPPVGPPPVAPPPGPPPVIAPPGAPPAQPGHHDHGPLSSTPPSGAPSVPDDSAPPVLPDGSLPPPPPTTSPKPKPGIPGGTLDPGPDPGIDHGWSWWWKYWWLAPILLFLLFLLGLLAWFFNWLGIFSGLVQMLKQLWEVLRGFLNPPAPVPPQPPQPPEEKPEEKPDDEEEEEDDDPPECEGRCEMAGFPIVRLDPSGPVVVDPKCLRGTIRVGHAFDVRAQFLGTCCCCEYRQHVSGIAHVRKRGTSEWLDIGMVIGGGQQLHPDEFREDGKPWFMYGHRKRQQNIEEDQYLMSRLDGCVYRGTDLPSIYNLSLGDDVNLHLFFVGTVWDMCAKPVPVARWSHRWEIHCLGKVELDMTFPYLGNSRYVFREFFPKNR